MGETMRRARVGIPVLACATVAVGCALLTPERAAIVTVDVVPELRDRVSEVEVLVLAEPERRVILAETYRIPEEVDLPLEVALAPGEGDADPLFHLVARAYSDGADPVASQLLLGTYPRGGEVRYRLLLDGDAEEAP